MKHEIRALTGLRGIAALFVAVFHFSYQGELGPPFVRRILGHGYMAVDLFFVLSGFVLALTYAEQFRNSFDWRTYASYMGRRLARIYPLYIVLTLVCTAVAYAGFNPYWLGSRLEVEKFLSNATMLQCLGGGFSIDIAAWSISTEFVASLIFPALCVPALFRRPFIAFALAGFCLLVIAMLTLVPDSWTPGARRAAQMSWLEHHDGNTLFALYRCLADFTLGLLTWRVYASAVGTWLHGRAWPAMVICGIVTVLLCVRNVDALTVSLFPALVLCLAADNTGIGRLLGRSGPEWLGLVSYSLYLVHIPIYDLLEPLAAWLPGSRMPITILDLSISLGVSYMTYTAIEKPGRRLGRNLVRKIMRETVEPGERRLPASRGVSSGANSLSVMGPRP